MHKDENKQYLSEQIITYIGNKRSLLTNIEKEVKKIIKKEKWDRVNIVDMFSGSGVVARMLKKYSSDLTVNDLEEYSCLINSCYLTNKEDFDENKYNQYKELIEQKFESSKVCGIIAENYAPKDDKNIQKGERVFYTRENAIRIDTYRKLIDEVVDEEYKKYFLAPLITEASIHVNTSGVFKGFYKNKDTGIGAFGGKAGNALQRIYGKVELKQPVLSNFSSNIHIHQNDAVKLSKEIKNIDIAYLDPPYNQHPYGSNYFMLNLIIKNQMPDCEVSEVSGIPSDWNRSDFNKKNNALLSMEEIIKSLDTKYFIISYNSEGFISLKEMKDMLKKYGKVDVREINYNTFRGSRNLNNRDIYVSEYLFILKKEN